MPTTQTGWEKRVEEVVTDLSVDLARFQTRKLAKKMWRMFDDYTDVDAITEICAYAKKNGGTMSDPTPREAFREISRNDHAAARRLGLVSA